MGKWDKRRTKGNIWKWEQQQKGIRRDTLYYIAIWPDRLHTYFLPLPHTYFQALELMEDCRRLLSLENGVSHPVS